jgi:hypothetical protein
MPSSREVLISAKPETAVSGKLALIVLVAATVFVVSVAFSLAMKDDMGDDRIEKSGTVLRCNLDGINPVNHPEIFGNPAVAASYGFVRSRDGKWHAVRNCLC